MNYKSPEDLRSILNPSVLTARAALMGGAANGDRNAQQLLGMIKNDERFENKYTDPDGRSKEELYRFCSAYGTAVWVRNKISDALFHALGMSVFIDLGCGLNPRALSFMDRADIHYYGIDLPAVTEKMNHALSDMITRHDARNRIMYISADVTDLASIRSAIRVKGPLFIVTEGLMMYLTENEMKTVVLNISELLAEYGGVWFTGDNEERTIYKNILMTLFGGEENAVNRLIGTELSEQWRSLLHNNGFVASDESRLKKFLEENGLNCRRTDNSAYIKDLSIPENIRKAFEQTEFLMMTSVFENEKFASSSEKSEFRLDSQKGENGIVIHIHGRLDSVTAPRLAEEYERLCGDTQMPLTIDMDECPYISSAGIRAVLMLYKRTKSIKDGFALRNIRPYVLEILTTTGLTDLMNGI